MPDTLLAPAPDAAAPPHALRVALARWVRPEAVFFLLVWLGTLAAFRERGFYDPGALWHVVVGEIILTQGFPHTDPFTYTFEGQPWVPQQWGAELALALLHRAGGQDLMLLAFATLVAGLFTWLFARALGAGMGPILAGLVVGFAFATGAFHYYVRPHMATIAFLGWTMACVADFERGRATLWRLGALIPLGVVWLNLHGGVWGGTMTLGLAVAGWGLLFLLKRDSPIKDWRTAWLLVGIVVAHGLTPLVNPFGLELIRIWRSILGSKVLPEIVNEHMPLDPTSAAGLAVIGFGVFYLLLLAGTLPGRPRVSWLIPLVWLALSFKGIRQGPLFAITAVVAAIDLWPHTVWHRLLLKYGDTLVQRPDAPPRAGRAWLAVPVLAVLAAAGLQLGKVPAPVVGAGWVRFDPAFVAVDILDPVRKYAASVPPGTRVFNDANLGGFLIYYAPSLKIFMDDRCEQYGDPWMKEYADRMALPPEDLGPKFEAWRAEYGFDVALIMTAPKGEDPPPVEKYLTASPAWREVARGKRAVMFERVR